MSENKTIAIVNVSIILCISALFYLTESGWPFLLLLGYMSTDKDKK